MHSLFVHRSRETSLRFEVFILENPCGGRVVVTVRTILGTFFSSGKCSGQMISAVQQVCAQQERGRCDAHLDLRLDFRDCASGHSWPDMAS